MRTLVATFGATGVNMALSLLTSIVVARYLGPEGRGALLVIIFWPTMILNFCQLSLNEATIYHVARAGADGDGSGRDRQCAYGLTLELFAVGVTTLGWLLFLPVFFGAARAHYLPLAMLYAAAITPLTILDLYYNAVRYGREDIRRLNILRLCQPVAYAAALTVLVVAGSLEVKTVLVATLLSTGVSVLVGLSFEGLRAPKWNLPAIRDMLRTALRLHATNLLLYASAEIDKLVVVQWMDEISVGLYAAALAVSMFGPGFVAQSLIVLAWGRISAETEQHQQRALVCRFTQAAILSLVLINGAVAVVCPWLVPTLYGKQFAGAVPVATILLLMTTFRGVRQVMDRALRAALIIRISIQGEIVGLISFIILAPIGSHLGKLAGIAWAMAGAQGLALIVMVIGTARHFDLATLHLLGLQMPNFSTVLRVATREYRAAHQRWLR
jgi:enterobacterial common antigen flippase